MEESARSFVRVLHVIPSISAVHGGPSAAIRSIVAATSALGAEVEVATTDDDGRVRRQDRPADGSAGDIDGMRVRVFPRQTGFYKVSLPLWRWLRERTSDYDVVHVHALFSFASTAAANAARRVGVPYIVRPLGVLDRYGMEKRRPALKRLSFALLERSILDHAAAVHFTAKRELEEAQRRVVLPRAVVIPLGVDVPTSVVRIHGSTTPPGVPRIRRIAYLGRLDPKKNVEAAIRALPQVLAAEPTAVMSIAGEGDAGYTAHLRQVVADLGLGSAVAWVGYVSGEAKRRLLEEADVFVLPSHSENFGMAAAEALAAGVPCVLGHDVAIAPSVATAGAGVAVDPTPEGVADGILGYLADESRRAAASGAARRLAVETYSTRRMGEELMALYRTIVAEHRRDDA